ncbi:hypothetical protein Tco_0226430 [Tanacetum coccineum]
MKVRQDDKPCAQHKPVFKVCSKQLRLEIGLKDALVEMPKFNKWLSSLLRNKEKLEEIAIITVNAECSAIIMNKVECFTLEDDIDEIDAFLAMEVFSNFEEGYFDSEGDITFLNNLLSDDDSHNLASEVISDHEPEQNESSITFSPRSDPLHHEFAGELLTLPSRNDHEFGEYLIIESLPILVEDSEPTQEEIDILLAPDNLSPPGVEDADSEDEVNESPNLDHQDDPSIP